MAASDQRPPLQTARTGSSTASQYQTPFASSSDLTAEGPSRSEQVDGQRRADPTAVPRLDSRSIDERLAQEGEEEPGEQLEPGEEESADEQIADGEGPKSGPRPIPQLPRFHPHRIARHLATVGLVVFAAIWGTLTREGLVALNTYSGQSIQPVIWAQAVGCLVMGWTVANKATLDSWYPPLYIMIGTGYCGSVTTFSSWILQVFQAYSNELHYSRGGLHNVMDALTQTFATLGLSLVALSAGRSIGKNVLPARRLSQLLHRGQGQKAKGSPADSSVELNTIKQAQPSPHKSQQPSTASPSPQHHPSPMLDLSLFLVFGILAWLGAALLAGLPPQSNFRPLTFSVVFGPPGALLRWYLSRFNSSNRSKKFPHWPLGTFAANMLATLVLAIVFLCQHYGQAAGPSSHIANTLLSCQLLYALQEGFCGCLSTISTFAVELSNLKPRRRAVGYCFGSYLIGIIIMILVVGVPWWSGGGMEGSCTGVPGAT